MELDHCMSAASTPRRSGTARFTAGLGAVLCLVLMLVGCESTSKKAPAGPAPSETAGEGSGSAASVPDNLQPAAPAAQEELQIPGTESAQRPAAGAERAPLATKPVQVAAPTAAAPPTVASPDEKLPSASEDATPADEAAAPEEETAVTQQEAPAQPAEEDSGSTPVASESDGAESAEPRAAEGEVDDPAPVATEAEVPKQPEPTAAKSTPPPAAPKPKPEPAPAASRPATPAENVIIDRNLYPGGKNRYAFTLADAHVTSAVAAGGGVQLVLESGRRVMVPSSGKTVVETFRNALDPTTGDTYLDVVAGYTLVAGLYDPSIVNEVIKNVVAYPSYFQAMEGKTYKYVNSYYTECTLQPVGKLQSTLDRNQADVKEKLAPYNHAIEPSASRFVLDLVIGYKNWFEKAEVTIEMVSTSYVLKDGAEIALIVNENSLVACPKGGTTDQNVVWVLRVIPGVGTLARYYQASESKQKQKGPQGTFREVREKLVRLNVDDYLQGIHDRALSLKPK